MQKLYNKSLNEIYSLERTGKKFSLTNIKKFLKLIGNPEKHLKVIHVAGTNGKGSVCAMINSALSEAGYKVGMFTSPHLVKFNERIRINNKLISNKDLDRLVKKIIRLQRKHVLKLSFFEAAAAIAYLYFKEKKVDYTILEVGMGGRLDATNTSNPILSIITSIGHDHMDFLGHSLREIAKEKAGIIKKNSTVVTGAKGIVLSVIKETCKKQKSKLILAKKTKIKTSLKGNYQLENASIAVTALDYLNIKESHIKKGLKNTKWPGRFHFIKKNILLDCAHNQEGLDALIKSLKTLKYRNLTVLISVMKDKNAFLIAKRLNSLKSNIILTKANIFRATEPESIKELFLNSIIINNPKDAINYAIKNSKRQDLIIITGSIFLVGDAYSFLSQRTPK